MPLASIDPSNWARMYSGAYMYKNHPRQNLTWNSSWTHRFKRLVYAIACQKIKFIRQKWNYLFNWDMAKDGPSDGNSRVEVASRDMTNWVTHYHYNKSPSDTNPWKCHRAIDLIHCYNTTPSKYHKICSNEFCNHLVTIKTKIN